VTGLRSHNGRYQNELFSLAGQNQRLCTVAYTGGAVDWCEVSDELWERLKPLLPQRPRRRRWPGRKPLDDRACLNGILFVLWTGIRWDRLPQQLGYGSGMTCWRRLRDWQQAGVWERLHALLLAELHAGGHIRGWAAGGGWLSGRSPGCTSIVGWRCAGSTAPTSTMGS
jgi:transposase